MKTKKKKHKATKSKKTGIRYGDDGVPISEVTSFCFDWDVKYRMKDYVNKHNRKYPEEIKLTESEVLNCAVDEYLSKHKILRR